MKAEAGGYIELCEELYRSWLNGTLTLPDRVRSGLRNSDGDTTLYSPEPYLEFDQPSDTGVAFLTTNPGDGEPFQRREAVGEGNPRLPQASYAEVASRLGSHYSGNPEITGLARRRIEGMRRITALLGETGFTQFQLMPFHSKKMEKSSDLNWLLGQPVIERYTRSLARHLERIHTVIGLANVTVPGEGKPLVEAFADVLGEKTSELRTTQLGLTVGVMKSPRTDRVRAIWCAGRYNQPPGKDLTEPFMEVLQES